jgi:GH15 family glucan-1,4-alpha-glucosidase
MSTFQNKRYQPIENYGVIGDLNTVALVGLNGSIDFMCFPNFDSPTIFASLLDSEKGGSFKIVSKADDLKEKQLYIPDTNILLTRFLSSEGISEITDFMPVETKGAEANLIRMVTCVHGQLDFEMTCSPRFNYAQSLHDVKTKNVHEISFVPKDGTTSLRLLATVPLATVKNDVNATFNLKTGEKAIFILELKPRGEDLAFKLDKFAEERLFETITYWKDWANKSRYRGRWMEIVNRSALVLKLMTSQKYGSAVASPTFGLPEEIGGVRNWDYRYTWIRDASFTMYTLLKLGYIKEARQYINWVERQCNDIDAAGSLRLMYTIDGRQDLGETELNHLEGYRGSRPVRIGNGAYNQIQMDIYGELLDAVFLYDKHAEPISYAFWLAISKQVNWVCDHWKTADEGIWEVRGGKREFLYSRMMCWVALDRAMKISEAHSYPLPSRWRDERDKIFHSIHTEFWNDKLKCFVQYRGAETVDAATLLMPLVRFIGPKDPRWLSTLERIETMLVSDSLVYRYRPNQEFDGVHGGEGTFSMCTFWYVECLSKSGQLSKARLYFDKMLGYANHVGLYSEQLGLQGQHLGNFPQAFTHLGLISAALSLDAQFIDQTNKEEFNHNL